MATQESSRKYPLKRPPNHTPPVPRWQLVFPSGPTHVHTLYLGVQQYGEPSEGVLNAKRAAEAHVEAWISGQSSHGAAVQERFTCIDGSDIRGSTVWVIYRYYDSSPQQGIPQLDLDGLYGQLDAGGRLGIGLWQEAFTSKVARIETNYTGLDYLPGIAQLPETSTREHNLTAYWGAARDRIPEAAIDRFAKAETSWYAHATCPESGSWQNVTGSNNENVVHIRSGQYWETCGPEEVVAYETKVEPALESGLQHLWDHPAETGARGIRYLRNTASTTTSSPSATLKETCVTGFFDNLADLEKWAHTHKSHLAIYRGAMNHAKEFGLQRKFRTWHEVSVLEKDASRFQYLNCAPGTGVAQFLS